MATRGLTAAKVAAAIKAVDAIVSCDDIPRELRRRTGDLYAALQEYQETGTVQDRNYSYDPMKLEGGLG